jgi:hypothetical protein
MHLHSRKPTFHLFFPNLRDRITRLVFFTPHSGIAYNAYKSNAFGDMVFSA